MYLIETIEDYFSNIEIGYPIFTEDIFAYAKNYYPDLERAVFNEYMTRVCERNTDIKRYQRGVYYKSQKTEEGYSGIRIDILLKSMYLTDKDKVIGYISGPAFMQKMGLTNDTSTDLYVVTNNYRSMAIDFENVYLLKPVVPVNNDNYKYLQVLDVLYNKWKVELNPSAMSVLYKFVKNNGLDFEQLLVLSSEYPGSLLPKKIAALAMESRVNK